MDTAVIETRDGTESDRSATAASAIAALKFSAVSPGWATDSIAVVLLVFSSLVIGALLVRTVMGIAQGELRALSA
jgi:tellurite resistance protein